MSEEREQPNATDPRALKEQRRREKREVEQAREDLLEVLRLPAGRRLLWRLIVEAEWCRAFASSYHQSGQQFAANEGRRGVGVQLMGEIMNADPQSWLLMQQEALLRSTAD